MKEFAKTDLLGDKKVVVRQTSVQQDGFLFHCHSHLQISVCLSGSGTYIFDKNQYLVNKGDIMILNKLECHKCQPDNDHTIFIFVEIAEDFIAPKGSSEFQYQYLQPFRYDISRVSPCISHNEPAAIEIKALLIEAKNLYENQNSGYLHEMDAIVKMIMAKLRTYFLEKYPLEVIPKHTNSIGMNEALNYVNNHYQENIKIERIAKLLNVSESRFRHIFKETMHISVKAYITRLRMTEAQKLLATTEMTIESIVFQCGFGNITHFYKIFKQYTHVTPSEYRKISLDYSGEEIQTHYLLL